MAPLLKETDELLGLSALYCIFNKSHHYGFFGKKMDGKCSIDSLILMSDSCKDVLNYRETDIFPTTGKLFYSFFINSPVI